MILINLLPWRERLEEERKRQFLLIALLCFGLSFALVFSMEFWLHGEIRQQQKLNAKLQSEIRQFDTKIATIRGLQEQRQQLIAQLRIIQALQENRSQAVRVFDQLVRIIPDGIYLTSMRRESNLITLTGKATSNNEIVQFLRQIETSDVFTSAKLIEVTTDTNRMAYSIDFTLQFKIK